MEFLTTLFRMKIFLRSAARSTVLGALCLLLVSGMAAAAEPLEYAVKAAFIYNFAKFVEWPKESSSKEGSFVIGILGRDPFGGALQQTVSGKTIRERKITVKQFSRIEDAIGSDILFISTSEKEGVAQILRRLDGAPVLTISDLGRFSEQGGMIEFVIDHDRVRFAINPGASAQAGLKPSSQLLKLARIITGPGKAKE